MPQKHGFVYSAITDDVVSELQQTKTAGVRFVQDVRSKPKLVKFKEI